jgi:hypothetical protein
MCWNVEGVALTPQGEGKLKVLKKNHNSVHVGGLEDYHFHWSKSP